MKLWDNELSRAQKSDLRLPHLMGRGPAAEVVFPGADDIPGIGRNYTDTESFNPPLCQGDKLLSVAEGDSRARSGRSEGHSLRRKSGRSGRSRILVDTPERRGKNSARAEEINLERTSGRPGLEIARVWPEPNLIRTGPGNAEAIKNHPK